MHNSVWTNNVKLPEFKTLSGDIKTDVLIIGGGMCGLLCAYFLKQAGIDYALLEGDKIASGVTKNTTAKITSQHGLIYSKLIKNAGEEMAKMYLNANEEAIKSFEDICKNTDCDFERKPAYTYSLSDRQKIEDEVYAVNSLGFKAEFSKASELPFKINGAIRFENQAQFNPLKFILEISKDLNTDPMFLLTKMQKNLTECMLMRIKRECRSEIMAICF